MKYIILVVIMLISSASLLAQDFNFEDFVDTWEGWSYSENTSQWNAPITLIVEPDGYYNDSSGLLMPSLYPNTQNVEYEESTNRIHFSYLYLVYAGQQFYQHIYFEVVSYDGNYLEMHYNFWDDPEPFPQVWTISLTRTGATDIGEDIALVPNLDLRNYPNPFNPETTIEFELPADGFVQLNIYNLRGQKVDTVVQEMLQAGRYQYIWRSGELTSGVYLARLKTGSGSEIRRLNLIK